MKILIIEDEAPAAEKLKRELAKLEADIEIMDVLDTVRESIEYLESHTPELIFCDIHLADGLSFNIFEKVQIRTPIIFTTAYDQYALQAFKLNSIDYLLKPINGKELSNSIKKYSEWYGNKTEQIDFKALINAMQSGTQEYQKRFLVYAGERIKTVFTEEIAYFFAEQKYVYMVTRKADQYIVDYTLDKLETLLDPEQFYRINRQFIIKIYAIKNMYNYPKSRVKLELDPSCKKEAIVSMDRAADFKQWLNK